jgi:hypothetical protein
MGELPIPESGPAVVVLKKVVADEESHTHQVRLETEPLPHEKPLEILRAQS